jgi:hypothetical protein
MRIRATCHACGRDFLFFQLYNADPRDSDRCPHCHTHLGVGNLRPLALEADLALSRLALRLEGLVDGTPAFTLRGDSVLEHLRRLVEMLSDPTGSDPQVVAAPTDEVTFTAVAA